MENPNTQAVETEKTFTQDEVNSIVKERLARERTKLETDLAEREAKLAAKEFDYGARELLKEFNLPQEAIGAVNAADLETLKKSFGAIRQIIDAAVEAEKNQPPIVSGRTPEGSSGSISELERLMDRIFED